jgi:hypothetical protein
VNFDFRAYMRRAAGEQPSIDVADYRTRRDLYETMEKRAAQLKATLTRMRTAERLVSHEWEGFEWGRTGNDKPGTGSPIPPEYKDMLDASLDLALAIIERLGDRFFIEEAIQDHFGIGKVLGFEDDGDDYNESDAPYEKAKKLVAAIEARRKRNDDLRRLRALENVTGREPEEAPQYLAYAAELRKRLGLEEAAG